MQLMESIKPFTRYERPRAREPLAGLWRDFRVSGRAYRTRLWLKEVDAIETPPAAHLVDRRI